MHSSGIEAKVIKDSISPDGIRLVTFQVKAPKFIDAEVEKHRMLSSNSGSDRARPVKKVASESPFYPPEVYYNQRGMQGSELLDEHQYGKFIRDLEYIYDYIRHKLDPWESVHKQHINRYFMPFSWQYKVITGTEWDNFFNLRMAEDAQPEIRILAEQMYKVMNDSSPKKVDADEWHMPYIYESESSYDTNNLLKASVARCARVSYTPYDQVGTDIEKDIELYERLYSDSHLSPLEHVARPMEEAGTGSEFNGDNYWEDGVTHMDRNNNLWSGNFRGWLQYRHMI